MLSRPPLALAVHSGDPALLADEWTSLADPQHPGAAFRSAAWLSSWWKNNSTSREAHVLLVHRGPRPVALLPLYSEGRRLHFMGDGTVGSDFLGLIGRRDEVHDAGRAVAAHLASLGCDEVVFDGLMEGDPLIGHLLDAFGARATVEERYLCPYVTLGDFSSYLASLPDGIGAQWHRRRRWLVKRPGYRLDVLRSPAEIAVGMDVLFELHRQRWSLEGGSEAFFGAGIERFHREAARHLAAIGWAVVFVLHAEGAARAALYGFRHGDRFAFYQAGHEPAWRPRSVGTVLLGHAIKWATDEGLTEFDFLRGDEPYKLRWATGQRKTVRVRALGAGVRPWLLDQRRRIAGELRESVKRALPESLLDRLRRLRRGLR